MGGVECTQEVRDKSETDENFRCGDTPGEETNEPEGEGPVRRGGTPTEGVVWTLDWTSVVLREQVELHTDGVPTLGGLPKS